MSEPYEAKFRQTRINLTAAKVRHDELKKLYDNVLQTNFDLYNQIKLAHMALFEAGYRRLEDMSWTKEPLETDGIEA